MSAEPTAEQRDIARVALLGKAANTVSPAVRKAMEAVWADTVEDVARALAAAVTAEREKVLAIHHPVSQNQFAAYPVKDPHDVCAHCNTHTWPCRTAYALGIREVSR